MRPSADNLAAIIAAIRRTVKRLSAADAVGRDRARLSSRARRTMIMVDVDDMLAIAAYVGSRAP
jgi:hypothetical protein